MEFSLKSFVVRSHPRRKSTKYVTLDSALTATFSIFLVFILVGEVQSFNEDRGILKWSPYYFSNNFRYSAPSSFYISPDRVGTPYKRFTDAFSGSSTTSGGSSSGGSGVGIYKWSPVFFSGGNGRASSLHSPSSYIGSAGAGYMYSANRPSWSSDYGGSRFLTRYYGGNSFVPGPRAPSVIDLAGSNDLSALLGDEVGLGLENDTVDVLDGSQSHDLAHKASKK